MNNIKHLASKINTDSRGKQIPMKPISEFSRLLWDNPNEGIGIE